MEADLIQSLMALLQKTEISCTDAFQHHLKCDFAMTELLHVKLDLFLFSLAVYWHSLHGITVFH